MHALITLFSDRRTLRALTAGCVALAVGGVVLLRAPRSSTATPTPASGPASSTALESRPLGAAPRATFRGPGLHGSVALSQGSVTDGVSQVYAEVRVAADEAAGAEPRPVAFAMVLDVSGSMSGDKIAQARQSVLDVVARMRDNDQIALVTYSDAARVVQPMARVGSVRQQLQMVVPTLGIEGGTNIPAGLSAGVAAASEAPSTHVRRVVLISDGRDGSGLSLEQIAQDARTRADRGVTLSSLGIGADYDEAFMSRLADAGRGNYEFLRDGAQLRAFLARELQQSAQTRVDLASVRLALPQGWTLARAYGAEVSRESGGVRLPVGALYAGEERRIVLDLRVDTAQAQRAGEGLGAMATGVSYRAAGSLAMTALTPPTLPLARAATSAEALASRDESVYAEAASTALAARQSEAVVAWREGRTQEADGIMAQNVAQLRVLQGAAPTPARAAQIARYDRDRAAVNTMAPGSSAGMTWGMESNVLHRRAQRSANAY